MMGTVAFFRRLAPALLLRPMFSSSNFLISDRIALITRIILCSLSVVLTTHTSTPPAFSPPHDPIWPANTQFYTWTPADTCVPFFIQSWCRSSTLGRQRNKQPIKSSNLVCHQTIDSVVTWWREWYFLLSDLMPTTFPPPVKYSSTLST